MAPVAPEARQQTTAANLAALSLPKLEEALKGVTDRGVVIAALKAENAKKPKEDKNGNPRGGPRGGARELFDARIAELGEKQAGEGIPGLEDDTPAIPEAPPTPSAPAPRSAPAPAPEKKAGPKKGHALYTVMTQTLTITGAKGAGKERYTRGDTIELPTGPKAPHHIQCITRDRSTVTPQ